MKPPSGPKNTNPIQTLNPVLSAAWPELAVALSVVEGVEWANFKPDDGFSAYYTRDYHLRVAEY